MLTVGSLFSGIGGFDEAFRREGFNVNWSCEIEPFPRRVLARHFPGVVCHEDVRTVTAATAERVDVLVGGFPCQDLSVAGKRAGLGGERSGLFFEFMRVADELKPTWVVVENVPGLLSSHRGADFAVVVNTLVELGYGVAWRVLDSQHFGVAQRRRRVFLVACAGGQHDRSAAVLFEREGGRGDLAAGEEAGAGLAAGAGNGADGVVGPLGGGNDGIGRRTEDDPNLVVPTLDQSLGHHRGSMGVGDFAVPAAFDTTQVTSAQNYSNPRPGDPCYPLAAGAHPPAVAFAVSSLGGSARQGGHAVNAEQAAGGQLIALAHSLRAQSQTGGVRRLTPTECERLQAFPDGWTCLEDWTPERPYSTATCRCPDSPRYRAIGNAVTVTVIQWIARRLKAAHEAIA